MTVSATGKAKAPISSHPVFPAVVALWFAALLGLGSMVLPIVLLEKLVETTGLAAASSAVEPPLGVTARILIALAAAAVGAVAGLAIARRVVAAQAPAKQRRRAPKPRDIDDAPAMRPISAHDELGVEKLDAPLSGEADDAEQPRPAPIPGRRRPLSVTAEHGRSDYLASVPLPGADPDDPPPPAESLAEAAVDPLDLGAFAEPEIAPHDGQDFGSSSLSGPPIGSPIFGRPAQRAPEPQAVPAEDRLAGDETGQAVTTSDEGAAPLAAPADLAPDPALASDPPPAEPRATLSELPAAEAGAAERSLPELGLVELVERFAHSLQRRGEAAEAVLELPQLKAPHTVATAPEPLSIAPEPEAASIPSEPAPFAGPPVPAIPAALRPIGFEEDDEQDEPGALADLALTLDIQARPFARPEEAAPAAARFDRREEPDDEPDSEEPEAEDDGYSSLLAMRSPLGAGCEFVRVDDEDETAERDEIEPVVVFPSQPHRRATPAADGPAREPASAAPHHLVPPAPGFRPFDGPADGRTVTHPSPAGPAMPTMPAARKPDPGETERALREALAKLQRMSGAA